MKKIFLIYLISNILFPTISLGSSYDWCMKPNHYKMCLTLIKPDAEKGNSNAQVYLGMMYQNGYGVLQNYKTAFNWYKLSAEQGDHFGQLRLGMVFQKGIGIKKDLVQAHKWFNLSAYNGDKRGNLELRKLDKLMNNSEIQNAQRLAEKCLSSDYKYC